MNCCWSRLKFVIIGDVATGKTTLTHRILHPDESPARTEPTVGLNADMKRIEDERYGRIDLLLFDTAGDDRFNGVALTQMYYRNAHGFLVLFDLTSVQSFRNVRDVWLPRVRAVMDPGAVCCFCLVGNKADLVAQRRVSSEEAAMLAISLGWTYVELAAREASHDELIQPFMLLIVPLVEAEVGRVDPAEEAQRLRLAARDAESGDDSTSERKCCE